MKYFEITVKVNGTNDKHMTIIGAENYKQAIKSYNKEFKFKSSKLEMNIAEIDTNVAFNKYIQISNICGYDTDMYSLDDFINGINMSVVDIFVASNISEEEL